MTLGEKLRHNTKNYVYVAGSRTPNYGELYTIIEKFFEVLKEMTEKKINDGGVNISISVGDVMDHIIDTTDYINNNDGVYRFIAACCHATPENKIKHFHTFIHYVLTDPTYGYGMDSEPFESIKRKQHPFHIIYNDFQKWCDEQGLDFILINFSPNSDKIDTLYRAFIKV